MSDQDPRESQPLPKKTPHRWDTRTASAAGRKGGQAKKRPKGLGKHRRAGDT